jgi:hypothetical protein
MGTMAPSDEDARLNGVLGDAPSRDHVRFSAWIYSLENSLPLIKLGQVAHWQPGTRSAAPRDDTPKWRAHLNGICAKIIRRWTLAKYLLFRYNQLAPSPKFLWRFLWFQVLLGWLLATLFLAGVTGIVHSR